MTEQGTERRAGVWCVPTDGVLTASPLDKLGPEADLVEPPELAALFARKSMRLHGFLRDQRSIAGLGRRLANEVCHRAKLSPFAMTGKLGLDGATKVVAAIRESVAEGLAYERTRDDMSGVQGSARTRARSGRRGLPGLRRHGAGRGVLGLHRELLPDVPDRRQAAGRQHDEPLPQVGARGSGRPAAATASRARLPAHRRRCPTSGRCRSSAARRRSSAACTAARRGRSRTCPAGACR